MKNDKPMRVDDPVAIAQLIKDYPSDFLVVVVGYYATIVDILNWLIKNTDAEFTEGELYSYDYDHYDDAFVLQYCDGDIYIDKFAIGERHLILSYDVVYIEEDFVDAFAEKNVIDNDVIAFGFDTEQEDTNKEDNYFCMDMDDDLCGFCCCIDNTKFKYRGSVKLTTDMVNKILNDFLD